MPLDPARLAPFTTRLAAADTAYDTALRAVAEAEARLARVPGSQTARAALRSANRALAGARTEVASARRALDTERLEALSVISTSGDLLGAVSGQSVLGLFPIGLEARLEPGRLRIRVWPDAVSTSTHDPRLTPRERDEGMRYWRAEASATDQTEIRAAWRVLAEAIGATRAAWTAQVLTPTNKDALGPDVEPVFPSVAMQDDEAPFVPRAGVLPDRWIAVGLRDGTKVVEQLGAAIPHDLAVGLDTTPSETASLGNREGAPIALPQRMRWLTDFTVAVQAGMAFDIPLGADIDRLDELFVFGVRLTETAAQGAVSLASLFTGHRYSRGLAFVPQDTPTNNTADGGAGLASSSTRIDEAFDLERQPRAYSPGARANGQAAARAFGVAPEVFAPVSRSGAVPEVGGEPDGFESEAAFAMHAALWSVTIGAAAEEFLALPDSRTDLLRTYVLDSVRASGPVPAIRVGRQPYGVLPVTSLSGFVEGSDEGVDPMVPRLLRAVRTWFAMRRSPALYAGTPEDALRVLGRSGTLYRETTRQDGRQTGANRWATLAQSLAVASRNSIRDTWRTGPIMAVVDAAPEPVTRPAVDPTVRAELEALAAATPQTLLARPVPESVLGRLARHAALLEWARFARGAVNACVDIPSRLDLNERSATAGAIVYVHALTNAFRPTVHVPPVGPIGPIISRDAEPEGDATRAGRVPGDRVDGPLGPTGPTVGGVSPIRIGGNDPPDLPDDLDPTPDPDPHPPLGEPEINPTERQKIVALVGSLSAPLASCPGAPRLASFRDGLRRLAQFPEAQLERALFGVLDVCNHRADAWFTSLATRRLSAMRARAPEGLVIGGWGVLQDVRRANPVDPQQRAEFIHTPSLNHAAAAAVLRSAARRGQAAGSAHADIDLSSRRVRLARWILDGVRNGRSLGELLGVRFERAVKGTPGEAQLGALRERFGTRGGFGVLDGLSLQQAGAPPDAHTSVAQAAEGLNDSLDAVADALTAEAVYQIVNGRPEAALVSLERIANGEQPPPLAVTETITQGQQLTLRVLVTLPAGATAPGWTAHATPRAQAEPLLDAWCGLALGPAAATTLRVEHGAGVLDVPLPALGIAAIDVVLAARDGARELAARVLAAARAGHRDLVAPRVRPTRAWKDLTGLCTAVARVIAQAAPLSPDAFEVPSAFGDPPAESVGDLPSRATAARAALATLQDVLAGDTDPAGLDLRAGLFGITLPADTVNGSITGEQRQALLAAVESRLSASATGAPRDQLRAIFGGDLPGIVTFTPQDPTVLTTATEPAPAGLFGNDRLAPVTWLDAVGRTRPNVALLAEMLTRLEVIGRPPRPPLVAQAPWTPGDRWIATAFTGQGGRLPTGRLSMLLHAPTGLNAASALGGLLVDAWTEFVPTPTLDTALALRFNNASTRAPQIILLGVSPDPSKAWTTETLVDVLHDTLAMMRLRMEPSTTLSQGGQMPLVLLGHRVDDTGISFSV